MIFCRIDRVVSLVLVAVLLICGVPALAVPAAAADTEMYLYNGYEFPAPPTYDSSTFPYSCIYYHDGVPGYFFFVSSTPITYSDGKFFARSSYHGSFRDYSTYWGNLSGVESGNVLLDLVVWADHDVIDESTGNVFLSGSNPVPVNPPSSISSVSIVSPDTVQASIYIEVSVDVSGTGDFDSSATLTLTGNTSSETFLEKDDYYDGNNWALHCAKDETAASLTVTAASVQDPSVTVSKVITVGYELVDPTIPSEPDASDPTDPTTPSVPDDSGDDSGSTDPEETVPEGTVVPGSGDLTDKSDQISGDLDSIGDYEQSQKDVLDNNIDGIMGQVDFVNLIPALAFVGNYINLAWVSMMSIQLIYTVPLFLGLFFFLCSRIPGATRWKARRPPPDPTKKR